MPTAKRYSGMIKSKQRFLRFTLCSHIHVCFCASVCRLFSNERVQNHTQMNKLNHYILFWTKRTAFLKTTYRLSHIQNSNTCPITSKKTFFSRKNWDQFNWKIHNSSNMKSVVHSSAVQVWLTIVLLVYGRPHKKISTIEIHQCIRTIRSARKKCNIWIMFNEHTLWERWKNHSGRVDIREKQNDMYFFDSLMKIFMALNTSGVLMWDTIV